MKIWASLVSHWERELDEMMLLLHALAVYLLNCERQGQGTGKIKRVKRDWWQGTGAKDEELSPSGEGKWGRELESRKNLSPKSSISGLECSGDLDKSKVLGNDKMQGWFLRLKGSGIATVWRVADAVDASLLDRGGGLIWWIW